MSEILFDHYPQSPASEKARCAFGITRLPWRSVEIPPIPAKPVLLGWEKRVQALGIGYQITPQ
ncbi:MAG: hypothetical protein CMQ61_09630 [Gammaproteobacteria bacterium]|nr:hypothetical protein [Gammaproteobacteria bacterium]